VPFSSRRRLEGDLVALPPLEFSRLEVETINHLIVTLTSVLVDQSIANERRTVTRSYFHLPALLQFLRPLSWRPKALDPAVTFRSEPA
jgi:hypothetical protein